MRTFSLLLSMGACAILGVATAQTVPAGARIQFETPVYEFGRVSSGDYVRHTFRFTNTGSEVLNVSNVKPACGCTTSGEWTRTVAPGATGEIPIQLKTANFNGPLTKTVTVTSNAGNQPTVVLQLKGEVFQPVSVTPNYLTFRVTDLNTAPEPRTVRISNGLSEDLTLSTPAVDNERFTAELTTVEPGREFDLVVTPKAPFEYGYNRATITIRSSYPGTPVITVNATALVQEPVRATPSRIILPAGPLTTDSQKVVTVRSTRPEGVTISSVALVDPATGKAADPAVEIESREIQENRLHRITLRFPSNYDIAAGAARTLRIQTNDPEFKTLDVEVSQIRTAPRQVDQPPASIRAPGPVRP